MCREQKDCGEYNFQLFWSCQRFFDDVLPQVRQIILNILFGVLVSLGVNGSRKRQLAITVNSACLLSGLVEFLQLLFKFGFAEFDDVFDKTLGAAIGVILLLMLRRVKREKK